MSRFIGPAGALLASALALASCGHDGITEPGTGAGPNPANLAIGVQGGDRQFGAAGALLSAPLQVVTIDSRTREPVGGVTIQWRITAGTGTLASASSATDSTGVASNQLTLGASGTVSVQATFQGNVTPPAQFTAQVAATPSVLGVTPALATAGDTVTISGTGFSPNPQDDVVLFGATHGAVLTATASALTVVVPLCLPSGTTDVRVLLGSLASASISLAVTGTDRPAVALERGEVLTVSDPAQAQCLRLAGGQAGASYLVVVENATDVSNRPMPFQLMAFAGGVATAAAPAAPAAPRPVASAAAASELDGSAFGPRADAWERSLRLREQELARAAGARRRVPAPAPGIESAAELPTIGSRRTFNVIDKDNRFEKVTAVAKVISTHAIVYEDVKAPPGGFSDAQYSQFAALFDDPIYDTDVAVYGAPSDLDQNAHIIILFTPVVNAMTPKGSTTGGYIAGFFYGCDLVSAAECSGTNQGEIFYSLVPDPTGQHGIVQTAANVLAGTPPVLAHEFMHMIHFNQRVLVRGAPEEALWLSEAMAHEAEDTVGGVFAARGDATHAAYFQRQNFNRAGRFLLDPAAVSLLAYITPGTLEERGAGWLFVKYLMGRFGGGILGRLAQTSNSSTQNITAAAATGWPALIGDWSVALWADEAPALAGVNVDRRFTFPNLDLRAAVSAFYGGTYPLQPLVEGYRDFTVEDTLRAGSAQYVLVSAGTGLSVPLDLVLDGQGGLPFPDGSTPQISLLRVR